MLFNSFEFPLFILVSFLLYWFVFNKWLYAQNLFLLIISYIFYGWWDWRFLSLIFLSSLIDFILAQVISSSDIPAKRKGALIGSLLVNLGCLATFKYFNFFSESFADLALNFGWQVNQLTLNVILPVGISFYTFQTLSYTIDVYRRNLHASKDPIAFFAYVSFFPQLVAGPIERAVNLLPQFYKKREFNYNNASDGLRQILWGLFKKVVIADNSAIYVNQIFEEYTHLSGTTLLLGAVFFAFQIYGDFSGYSDMAIGTAKLFGFSLMTNFKTPYFSRDIAEFWRRWHISLSTWFRDYVYIPLGGSRLGKLFSVRNTFIIFLISGFWHGANWTFIVWGALNALYVLPLILFKRNRNNTGPIAPNRILPSLTDAVNILITFFLTTLAWVFFRANSVTHGIDYINQLFSNLFAQPEQQFIDLKLIALILLMLGIEWLFRNKEFVLEIGHNEKQVVPRWALYISLIGIILLFAPHVPQNFIYFQF